MNKLTIRGKTVTVDMDALSKGLCGLHEQNENTKTILAFGMLDARIIKSFEDNFSEGIKSQFSEGANVLYQEEIESFIKRCSNEITKGIYKYAKMVV